MGSATFSLPDMNRTWKGLKSLALGIGDAVVQTVADTANLITTAGQGQAAADIAQASAMLAMTGQAKESEQMAALVQPTLDAARRLRIEGSDISGTVIAGVTGVSGAEARQAEAQRVDDAWTNDPTYKAGYVAGTVAPLVFSGGGAVLARGASLFEKGAALAGRIGEKLEGLMPKMPQMGMQPAYAGASAPSRVRLVNSVEKAAERERPVMKMEGHIDPPVGAPGGGGPPGGGPPTLEDLIQRYENRVQRNIQRHNNLSRLRLNERKKATAEIKIDEKTVKFLEKEADIHGNQATLDHLSRAEREEYGTIRTGTQQAAQALGGGNMILSTIRGGFKALGNAVTFTAEAGNTPVQKFLFGALPIVTTLGVAYAVFPERLTGTVFNSLRAIPDIVSAVPNFVIKESGEANVHGTSLQTDIKATSAAERQQITDELARNKEHCAADGGAGDPEKRPLEPFREAWRPKGHVDRSPLSNGKPRPLPACAATRPDMPVF